MGRSIHVIYNPQAGRGKRTDRWLRAKNRLMESGAAIHVTDAPGHATEIVRSIDAHSLVVVAGGDGTVSEVINGIDGRDIALAVLPLGTGNDLCRALGFGTDLEHALQVALTGTPFRADLYRWQCEGRSGVGINVAGCGFDAVVAHRINTGYRWVGGTVAYVAAVVECLFRYRPAPVRIVVDGEVVETTAMLAAVANGSSYGGGMKIAPNARLDSGQLNVIIVEGLPPSEFLRAFPRVFRGTHLSHPKVRELRGRVVQIDAEGGLPILVDGELVGKDSIRIEVLPAAIEIMRP